MKFKSLNHPALVIAFLAMMSCSAKKEFLYVGTVDQRGSEGIYVYEFNRKDYEFTKLQTLPEIVSPNFLTLHPSGNFLYAVNNTKDSEGNTINVISSFAINKSDGSLSFINSNPSYGRGACHVSLDHEGKWAFISHYGSGSLSVFPVGPGGETGDSIQTISYDGRSITSRQESSHVHSILVSPDNKFVYLADLGTDKMMTYSLDNGTGRLTPAAQAFISLNPGSGPRHFTFHPSKPYIFIADELSSSVTVVKTDPSDGSLTKIETLSTLPENFDKPNSVADIHTDPDGNFLYVSNRGHNSIAIYRIQSSGNLEFLAHTDVNGEHPRNFMIDPKGEFLIVANRDTDNVVVFRLDKKTGLLESKGIELKVPAALCLKWSI